MPNYEFVDTHVHFWDHSRADVQWDWLAPGVAHPVLGDIEAIKRPRFGPEELLAETAGAAPVKVVHVEATMGTREPVNETRWLQEMAGRTGLPHAIVAYADLAAADAERQLTRHIEASDRVRGVRAAPVPGLLERVSFRRGAAAAARAGLIVEVAARDEGLAELARFASARAAGVVVLEHAGRPSRATFAHWRERVLALARIDSVHCKISGLGMGDRRWSADTARRAIDTCLESFGPERCFFGTNWPVDRLFAGYNAVVASYREAIAELSRCEQRALLSGNAEALYQI
jgi:predicted TIM-barrel fold metal-dependent hydrolase